MITSNYETLMHSKVPKLERVQWLENQVKELRTYHSKARQQKKITIWRLINAYELLLDKCYTRMAQISL